MSNIYTTRPIKIDATMAANFSTQTGAHVPLRVFKVYWETPTTIDHKFTIVDGGGTCVLLEGNCEVAKQSQMFEFPPVRWKDFKVTVLGSGILWIYTK